MSFNNQATASRSPDGYINWSYVSPKGVLIRISDSSRLYASKKLDNAQLRKHEALVVAHQAFIAAGGDPDDVEAPPTGFVIGDPEGVEALTPGAMLGVLQLAGSADELDTDDV